MMNIPEDYNDLRSADNQCLWHPFTQMKEWVEEEPLIISEGRDCFIKDVRGRWYLDGVSSLWVNIHGHRRRELDEAIKNQLNKIAHTTQLGLASVPAIRLAQRLVELVGRTINPALSRVFYSDNGSTAVEVALKMAFQYYRHKGEQGRTKFISIKNAYHGDTLGAVSVGGMDIFHKAFGPLLFDTYQAPSPDCYRCKDDPKDCGKGCLKELDVILTEHAHECAGLIIEPMVQAAGGMVFSPPGYLKGVEGLCKKHNVLLIADEIATGFGRTGRMFACGHEGVRPDIVCLSKGITGGYMPLAATIATGEIYNEFLGEFSEQKTFFHGHSYTGHPLACACALASLDVFESDKTIDSMAPKTEMLSEWLDGISTHPHVGRAQGLGLMAAVEVVRDKAKKEEYGLERKMGWQVCHAARTGGVILRPLGNVVVIMPPLAISLDNLRQMLRVLKEAIDTATH